MDVKVRGKVIGEDQGDDVSAIVDDNVERLRRAELQAAQRLRRSRELTQGLRRSRWTHMVTFR